MSVVILALLGPEVLEPKIECRVCLLMPWCEVVDMIPLSYAIRCTSGVRLWEMKFIVARVGCARPSTWTRHVVPVHRITLTDDKRSGAL